MSKLCSVITTIQPPTPAVRQLCRALCRLASQLLVLGDRKGPPAHPLDGAEFFGLDRQLAHFGKLGGGGGGNGWISRDLVKRSALQPR
jgi:hypothetical protein